MESGRKIRWSQRATKDTDAILDYLKENWTDREVANFLERLRKFSDMVVAFPEAYPQSKKGKLRKAVISKQNSVIYRIKSRTIEIVTIIDNRSRHSF